MGEIIAVLVELEHGVEIEMLYAGRAVELSGGHDIVEKSVGRSYGLGIAVGVR